MFEGIRLSKNSLGCKSDYNVVDAQAHFCFVQALWAETALTLAQVQHAQQLQQFREQAGLGSREQLAHLQAQLTEERRRGQQLEETLRTQAQQASAQMGLQQVLYCTTGNVYDVDMV
jgi:hypothetical protein